MGEVTRAVRLLSLFEKLMNGGIINIREEMTRYEVNEKTIRRDANDIRAYLAEIKDFEREIVYDRSKGGYVMRMKGEKKRESR